MPILAASDNDRFLVSAPCLSLCKNLTPTRCDSAFCIRGGEGLAISFDVGSGVAGLRGPDCARRDRDRSHEVAVLFRDPLPHSHPAPRKTLNRTPSGKEPDKRRDQCGARDNEDHWRLQIDGDQPGRKAQGAFVQV